MQWSEKEKKLDEQLKHIHEKIVKSSDAQDIQRLVEAEKTVIRLAEHHLD